MKYVNSTLPQIVSAPSLGLKLIVATGTYRGNTVILLLSSEIAVAISMTVVISGMGMVSYVVQL